jgi:6-phosphogluconolactonase
MKNKPVLIYKDNEAMSVAAAHFFVVSCKKSIIKKGYFSVALSGAATPQRFHQLLAQEEFSRNICWEKVFIFFSDERYVPHTNTQSNYFMAKESLLDKIKIPVANVFPVPTHNIPKKDAAGYEKQIINFFKDKNPRFDFLMLGIGANGHTASLFPGSAALKEKKSLIVATTNPETNQDRITFSYSLINRAHQIILLATGNGKAPIIAEAINGKKKKKEIPVHGIQPKKGSLLCMLDEEAARLLTPII